MTRIRGDRHDGLLIKSNKVVGRYTTKKEIADGITRHMLGEMEGGGL